MLVVEKCDCQMKHMSDGVEFSKIMTIIKVLFVDKYECSSNFTGRDVAVLGL